MEMKVGHKGIVMLERGLGSVSQSNHFKPSYIAYILPGNIFKYMF